MLREVRGGLAEPEVQPILSGAICSVLLYVGLVDVCATCWWEISNVCSLCLRDLPTLILVHALSDKETKMEMNKGSTSLNTREPKTYLLSLLLNYYFSINLLCLFLFVHQSFYTQARLR